jgi:hypothetical protein
MGEVARAEEYHIRIRSGIIIFVTIRISFSRMGSRYLL